MRSLTRVAAVRLFAILLLAAAMSGQTPRPTYAARRAAAIRSLGTDVLVVPSRASFNEADQRGFVQAPNFHYLTGLEEVVGAVLVLDGAKSGSTLFVPKPAMAGIPSTQF